VLFIKVAIFSLVVVLSVCRNELQRDSAVCDAGHWHAHLGDRRKDAMPWLWTALWRETFAVETEPSSMPTPPKPG